MIQKWTEVHFGATEAEIGGMSKNMVTYIGEKYESNDRGETFLAHDDEKEVWRTTEIWDWDDTQGDFIQQTYGLEEEELPPIDDMIDGENDLKRRKLSQQFSLY
ncbi:hypothetical protein E5676_scaffold434G002960 [Cucumis melo var. makuwa]|uniref:Uncharacterized protein n=1 Tax=Cucumis melo var. makuwa TaxID=1194695 RepID=A0A5D3D0S6_CUCMM|nr:hypothetical protein E5676_scaffold434G002960 [Cucumis melo var. makuwa]